MVLAPKYLATTKFDSMGWATCIFFHVHLFKQFPHHDYYNAQQQRVVFALTSLGAAAAVASKITLDDLGHQKL